MPVTGDIRVRKSHWVLWRVIAIVVVATSLFYAAHSNVASAQSNPFGSRGAVQADGIAGWILSEQASFYRALSSAIHKSKADGSSIWKLAGISLLYGIFHAAGPGHGKAVVSSYLVANRETWQRGVILSLASSMLQAFTAVLIVSIGAILIGVTGKAMGDAVRTIELFSFGLIMLLGARLAWSKGTGFLRAIQAIGRSDRFVAVGPASVGCTCAPDTRPSFACEPVEASDGGCHAHDPNVLPWGHAHGPEPQQLVGPDGWRRGLAAVIAVGIRPCSGAILVLVFALSQGIFWVGVVSTFMMGLGTAITVGGIAAVALGARRFAQRITDHRDGCGMLLMRAMEFIAAIAIFGFGGLFLAGYLASERLIGS